jgi:hypothetical protein
MCYIMRRGEIIYLLTSFFVYIILFNKIGNAIILTSFTTFD